MVRDPLKAWLVVGALLSGAAGCSEAGDGFQKVQRAVGQGAQAALAARPVLDTLAPEVDAPSVGLVPVPEVDTSGAMRFTPDANHQQIAGVRTADGFAVTWTDGDHSSVYFGRLDRARRAAGPGTRLHATVVDEEGISSPSVVSTPDGYGVAWADRENGRVRFARIDARGALRGRVAILHDGVESPQTTRLTWTGREFGVAVGLWQGVYFARVSSEGTRVGEPVLLHEGSPLRSLDSVEWDGRAYSLSFTLDHEGRPEQVQQRVAAHGSHG